MTTEEILEQKLTEMIIHSTSVRGVLKDFYSRKLIPPTIKKLVDSFYAEGILLKQIVRNSYTFP